MFKFLRRYNKWILAVGGTLLMIVFLIPQAIDTLSRQAAVGNVAWATIGPNDDDVSGKDRRECQAQLEALEVVQRASPGLAITDLPEHWYLLLLEADEAGLTGAGASAQLPSAQMDVYYQLAGRRKTVDEALGNLLAIQRMMQMYQSAGKLSDSRLRGEARRMFHSVEARILPIEASAETDAPDPAQAEIDAQFEKYSDVVPGSPDAETGAPGFGYRLPDRFKVEWITVSADSVREMIEAGDALNAVALFKHWQRYQTDKSFPEFDAETDIPDAVIEDLTQTLVDEALAEIERFMTDRIVSTWRRIDTLDGFMVLPDDWGDVRTDFAALAEEIQADRPDLPLPAFQSIGDRWLGIQDIADLGALATATTDRYGVQPVRAAQLIQAIREFGGDPAVIAQTGVAGPPLHDRDGTIVFYRVTDVDPARPPHDVTEVRDEVVRDLRLMADYERLKAMASSLKEEAKQQGLLAVALTRDVEVPAPTRVHLDSMPLLEFQLQNNFQLERASSLPVVGQHDPVIGQIVDFAMALDDTRSLFELPLEDRTMLIPVDDHMTLLLVELITQEPLTIDKLRRLTSIGLRGLLVSEELAETDITVRDAFSYDTLAKRHNFKLKVRESDTQPDDAASEDEATAQAE